MCVDGIGQLQGLRPQRARTQLTLYTFVLLLVIPGERGDIEDTVLE